MPNISEFEAGNLAIHPSETGVESQAAAGRRLGAYGSQIAGSYERAGAEIGRGINTAEEYVGHQEISAGAASGAQLISDQLEKKDAAIKSIDPNDPHYGQKVEIAVKQWRDGLETSLQDFSNQFHTKVSQDWSQRFVDNQRESMFVHSTADIQTAAGIGIHNSAKTIVNSATNTVFQHPDMLASQIDLVDHGITGLVQSNPVKGVEAGRVQSETMEKAKEQLVKTAVQGTVMKGGNWQAIANDPRYSQYVNGPEMAQFDKAAKIQDKQARLYATQLQNEQRRAANSELNNTLNASSAKNVKLDPDGTMHIDPQYIKDVNNLTNPIGPDGNPRPVAPNAWKVKEGELKRIEGFMKHPAGGVTDDAVRDDFNARLETLTTSELRQAQIPDAEHPAGRLSTRDFGVYEGYIKARDADPTTKNPAFKYATDQVKARLEGGNPVAKLHNAGKFAEFMQDFVTRYTAAHRAGPLPDNVLNLKDPKSLISQTLREHAPDLGQTIQQNGGVGAPLKTGPIAPPLPKTVPQASM